MEFTSFRRVRKVTFVGEVNFKPASRVIQETLRVYCNFLIEIREFRLTEILNNDNVI